MNIFFLDREPKICAKYHNDKHVVKMILEYAQLLCTAHHLCGTVSDELYKPTHKNHPSAVWVRRSQSHYAWLYDLFIALQQEYTYRYNKTHASSKLNYILSQPPDDIRIIGWLEDPPQAMPDEYKTFSAVTAYRQYYISGKSHIAKWTRRDKPYWIPTTKAS
jgi:hypothetical protein